MSISFDGKGSVKKNEQHEREKKKKKHVRDTWSQLSYQSISRLHQDTYQKAQPGKRILNADKVLR